MPEFNYAEAKDSVADMDEFKEMAAVAMDRAAWEHDVTFGPIRYSETKGLGGAVLLVATADTV